MSDRRGKKRPKSYYRKSAHAKRQKTNSLAPGMRGFLVTCNNNEKQAVRESYNILNEYADELYGAEQKEADPDQSGSESEEDMEKAMEKEVSALKEQAKERRFQNTDTGGKNCIFIRTTLEDPTELHHKIFSDLYETKKNKARFAMRMLPILGSCKAVIDEVRKLAEEILPKFFSSEMGKDKSYSVLFKCRNNSGVSRDSVQSVVGEVVKGLNPLNRVNCDDPEVAVLVEVCRGTCCIGAARDFVKFRKYNFHEVIKSSDSLEKSQNKDSIDTEVKDSEVTNTGDADEEKIEGSRKAEEKESGDQVKKDDENSTESASKTSEVKEDHKNGDSTEQKFVKEITDVDEQVNS